MGRVNIKGSSSFTCWTRHEMFEARREEARRGEARGNIGSELVGHNPFAPYRQAAASNSLRRFSVVAVILCLCPFAIPLPRVVDFHDVRLDQHIDVCSAIFWLILLISALALLVATLTRLTRINAAILSRPLSRPASRELVLIVTQCFLLFACAAPAFAVATRLCPRFGRGSGRDYGGQWRQSQWRRIAPEP
ncbi:unnamed protein product [Soboliphyme baturini]|uniref:G_PROTEIN_RECEP_F1_2 domain-containing protein n=1 Tax=Soboliphyme baturini TaxID=241478 RepID=A0A183J7D5_9BILA|nr:unnamed protein product [Soboliphyme baturini]